MSEPMVVLDGKAECPHCSKWVTVTASGALRTHKCAEGETPDGVRTVAAAPKPRVSKAALGKKAPAQVRSLATSLIAGGVEFGTVGYMAKAIPCERKQIPEAVSDIPDADKMVGPFIELVWPTIPKGTQKVIAQLAEHEDIITALFLWAEYFGKVRAFTDAAHQQYLDSRPKQPVAPMGGIPNVVPQASNASNGRVDGTVVEPFVPAG